MNLTLPAFGQKTAVGRNLHVSGRGFFALSPRPPMGYKNLMCVKLRRLGDVRVRWFSYHPPCLTDLLWLKREGGDVLYKAVLCIKTHVFLYIDVRRELSALVATIQQ